MNPRLLLIETSCSPGLVGLARGDCLLGERRLEEARRHARDLAPMIRELLTGQSWKARDLDGVIVGKGPGSYTGLRVGIMTAKALAYALGCKLIGIDTFAVIARQAPAQALRVDVLADAQQSKVYVQKFARSSPGDKLQPLAALDIRPFADWLTGLEPDVCVTGPGVRDHEERLHDHQLAAPSVRVPGTESLLSLGRERLARGESDGAYNLEPLYLRPSAAEEKWREVTK